MKDSEYQMPADSYHISADVARELVARFTYHPPKNDQTARYEQLRQAGYTLAQLIATSTPPSREQSLAFTHLEEAIMQANAAIARRE